MNFTFMEERKQPISQDTLQLEDRTESGSYVGGQTFMGINETNLTSNYESEYGLLEQILSPTNLNLAYLKVMKNKGAGGVDKMEVESLKDYLVRNKEALLESITNGKCHPNSVRRVEISKENGKDTHGSGQSNPASHLSVTSTHLRNHMSPIEIRS